MLFIVNTGISLVNASLPRTRWPFWVGGKKNAEGTWLWNGGKKVRHG